ncbi:MAG: histidine kinase [Bacteroidetes bacterium]|nr:histidine kinase [Bacteroidota bacterium]
MFSQTPTLDSLIRALPFLKDTARVDCLNELGSELSDRYWSRSKYQQTDSALMFTLQAFNESKQINYIKGIGRAWQNLGYVEEEHGNLKSAEEYTRKALHVLQKENIDAQYHRCHVFLGWILNNRGFLAKSIQIFRQELPYYEAIKDSTHVAAISRMTARAYDAMGNSGEAFNYFQKDFAIQKNSVDSWGKRSSATLKAAVYLAAGDTLNAALYYKQAAIASVDQHVIVEAYHSNMAIAYRLLKKYDTALLEMRKSISIIQSSTKDSLYRKVALMTSYNTLADLFISLKKYDSALMYGRKAMLFFKTGDYIMNLMPALKTIAAAYYALNKNNSALYYTNQLLAYSRRSDARRFERDGYNLLSQVYAAQHKTILAGNYNLKYILLNDSLENNKYISQAAAWKAINDININEANYKNQLNINEARIIYINDEKKIQLYVFIATISVISLLTVLMIRNTRLKRKQDQLQLMMTEANIALEKQKREQEVSQLSQQKTALELQALRAQMNPHFIFNCLNSINRFIINNDAAKAADYLTKFAKLIRIVLEQSGKSFVPLEDELKCLQLYIDLEALRFETPFQYEINCNNIDISSVMIPTLLIQPFVENAIWHGLQGIDKTGKINIAIHVDDKILHCKICDNGVGRTAGALKDKSPGKKSLGMNITQHRLQLFDSAEYANSAIEIFDLTDDKGLGSGTCVQIKIPVKEI